MRLWVLLNMETPERKPASSTAKRPRVTERAASSLHTARARGSGLGTGSPPSPPATSGSDRPAPSPRAHSKSRFSYSSRVNLMGRQAWTLLSWGSRAERRAEVKMECAWQDSQRLRPRAGWGEGETPGDHGEARGQPWVLTRDQNKVMTTTRWASSVRKREGTSPETRLIVPSGRGEVHRLLAAGMGSPAESKLRGRRFPRPRRRPVAVVTGHAGPRTRRG